MVGQTLNLNSRSLSIESGGLLVTGAAVIQGTSTNQISGNLTVGSARDKEAVLNIINPSQLTLFTQIQDFTTTATIGAHPVNSTVLTVPAAGMVGLVEGMEVIGGGAAIPTGARILSVDRDNNRITLNVPTAAAIPVNTIVAFIGGSVSLAKSGGGLLLLNGNSSYTGKTTARSALPVSRHLERPRQPLCRITSSSMEAHCKSIMCFKAATLNQITTLT
jgi:autotransporter-associated beta strand protein